MLYIVLVLVLGALGLLVSALLFAQSIWAWGSIAVSVLAGLLLVVDFFVRRSARKRRPATAETKVIEPEPEEPEHAREPATEFVAGPGEAEDGDPAEEHSREIDVEVVSELAAEVLVVDEYPRYHLTGCTWLADRETIPITVREARSLGFTPCARCTPDAHLAAAQR